MSEEYDDKIPDVRDHFLDTYADNLRNELYDDVDLDRIRTQDIFVRGYLLHSNGDVTKAASMLDNSLQFRKKMDLSNLKESSFDRSMHEMGGMYYHNHDKDNTKILYFRICKLKKDPERAPMLKKFIAWWIDKHYLKHPDQKLVTLFDMTDAGLSHVDVDLLKFKISCFTTYYPYMLEYMLVYEMPWILNAVWKLVKTMLSAEQQRKVIFIKKNGIQKHIEPDQLFRHMGGNDDFEYQYIPSEDSGIDMNSDNNMPSPLEEVSPDIDLLIAASSTPDESKSTPENSRKKVTFAEKDETLYSSVVSEEDANKSNSAPATSQEQNPYGNDKAVNNVATISPGNTLEFCVTSPSVQPTDVISIKSNLANTNMAFKVKTTTLGRYKVRPAIGIVKPNNTVDVIVTLEEKIEDQAQIAKDKFLIICQEVDSEVMLSQVSDLIRAVPKFLQTEHRLKVMMTNADSFNTPRKTEANHTAVPSSSRNSVNAVGAKELDDIQRKLERICDHNAQLESRLSSFGKIMFVQCCLMLVLIYMVMSNYWNQDLPKHNNQCKPWSLEE